MHSRQYKTAKIRSNDCDAPAPNQFAPRRFVVQPQVEQTPQHPDLQAQSVMLEQSNHNLLNLPIFSNSPPTSPPPIQMKLTIGQPGDKYEQEADQVAGDVLQRLNMPKNQRIQHQEMPQDKDELQMQPMMQGISSKDSVSPSIQRFVTFDSNQEEAIIIGKQGMAGYDNNNINFLAEDLVKTYLSNTNCTEQDVIQAFAEFLNEQDISFKDSSDAAQWVKERLSLSTKEEKTKKSSSETIRAFRVEGEPKSEMQLAGIQKLVPEVAIDKVLNEIENLTDKQQVALKEDWQTFANLKDKDKGKALKEKKWDKKAKQLKLQTLPSTIINNTNEVANKLNTGLTEGTILASRISINNSHLIERKVGQGKVTGLSAPFNFSVGQPDHASYFTSTFNKKMIMIEFCLNKEAWRDWKINKSGPQESNLGFSAPNKVMTLNDVNQPGVKYEINDNQVDNFYKEVIAKEVPAKITPLYPTSKYDPEPYIENAILRLKKVHNKLEKALQEVDKTLVEKEFIQLEESKQVLASEINKDSSKEMLESLYKAISLTKNALHSVRRKSQK
ncbi:MAG: hypothetical protein AB3A66_22950 [Nodularia sp. CChRGM 3473]